MVKTRVLIVITVLICLLSVVLCIVFFTGKNTDADRVAVVTVDGEIVYEVNLSKVTDPFQKEIVTKYGKNILFVEKNNISIIDADCQNKECVHTGKIGDGSAPIVCLPHHLVIKITKEGAVDAVSE